jgi:formamidopyrimidine-DNA glycosylase
MPELPDVTVYLEALAARVSGRKLLGVRLASAFVLRTFDPPLSAAAGKKVLGLRRVGKRLVLELEGDLFLVIHLMIAGRLRWLDAGAKIPGKVGLAAFDFDSGTAVLTEVASKKRASIHLLRGEQAVREMDRGGIEPLEASLAVFREALLRENHTLKRSLTDPRLFSGIGNAYSDEILHRARLSPVQVTHKLDDDAIARLYEATQTVLVEWTDRLRAETRGGFPEKVTAFREGMAVHGRYRLPCPVCGTAVQRIAYAENETNYCPRCQTGGRILSDRSLSRLLKEDWPRTVEELEERFGKLPR